MQENKKLIIKRAAKTAAFTVAGGVAFIALQGTASADVVVQDSDVTNAGVGVANSGGNVAVGNASQNTAATGQVAAGGIASNVANTSNESNGTASIETGDAQAAGNQSATEVSQAAGPDGDPGLDVIVQDSDVTNAGVGVANTGLNAAVGNASQNTALTGQLAVGFLASNVADTSNSSDGSASIKTGDATATGNQSATKVSQDAAAGDGPGLAVIVQDSDVANLGLGLANTGGNLAVGNASQNTAATLQGAFGLFASNIASTKNASNGSASIQTGDATATGNKSYTEVDQDAHPDPDALAVVFQSAPVLNAGIGIANSGGNAALGNVSSNTDLVFQISFGLLASNVSDGGNWSDGFAFVGTGSATGTGNESATKVDQDA